MGNYKNGAPVFKKNDCPGRTVVVAGSICRRVDGISGLAGYLCLVLVDFPGDAGERILPSSQLWPPFSSSFFMAGFLAQADGSHDI